MPHAYTEDQLVEQPAIGLTRHRLNANGWHKLDWHIPQAGGIGFYSLAATDVLGSLSRWPNLGHLVNSI